jgi:hypothetical protein
VLLIIALIMAYIGYRPAIALMTISTVFAVSGPLARGFGFARGWRRRPA